VTVHVLLGEVIDVASGQVDPRTEPYLDLPHVGGDNIESGSGSLCELRTARELNLISGKYEFGPDDVLYSKIRPALNKVALPDFAGICSADMYPLRPRPGRIERRYLAYVLRQNDFLSYAEKHSSRTNIPKINRDALLAYQVRLPPLTEQCRIADLLDKADAIRRKRKEAIALTEELVRSAFLEMFGDPVTNPKGWPVKALGDALDHLDAGWSANGDARPRAEDEYGVLKISAVTSGIFRPDEHKAVSASAIDRELVTPRRGDLLFSRANTRELVAATCLVERDEPRLFLPDKLWRVVPRADAATAPYLRFLLAHDRFRSELTKTATGTSGSMLNVSMEKLRGLRGPFPPIDQQKRFAALVWKSLDAKAKHEAAHETTETLFNALVARTFSGALEAAC